MTEEEMRDHCQDLLIAIAEDEPSGVDLESVRRTQSRFVRRSVSYGCSIQACHERRRRRLLV